MSEAAALTDEAGAHRVDKFLFVALEFALEDCLVVGVG